MFFTHSLTSFDIHVLIFIASRVFVQKMQDREKYGSEVPQASNSTENLPKNFANLYSIQGINNSSNLNSCE